MVKAPVQQQTRNRGDMGVRQSVTSNTDCAKTSTPLFHGISLESLYKDFKNELDYARTGDFHVFVRATHRFMQFCKVANIRLDATTSLSLDDIKLHVREVASQYHGADSKLVTRALSLIVPNTP